MSFDVKEVAESLAPIVSETVKTEVAEANAQVTEEIKNLSTEVVSLKRAMATTGGEIDPMKAKNAIVAIAKNAFKAGVNSESQFKSIVASTLKAMGENDTTYATAGEDLVFNQFERDVLQVVQNYGLVNEVSILSLVKGDVVNLPKVTNGITTAYVAEAGTPTDSDLVTAQVTFNIYKAMTLTNVTEELLEDSMTTEDVYTLIVKSIGESQGAFLENEILNGTGTNAITGIYTAVTTNIVSLGAGEKTSDISDADLVDVVTRANTKFKKNPQNLVFVMSQYTYGKLMALKTADGYPLYPELRNFQAPRLMGYRVILSDKNPVQNLAGDIANAKTLVFGDFREYYKIVRRKGLTIERGYYGNNWRDGIQSIKSQMRAGGKPTFEEAFVVLRNGA